MTKVPSTYTEDLSFDYMAPDAPAMFMPSLGSSYLRYASRYEEYVGNFGENRTPALMHKDGRELNFLREDSASFYWPYVLYSAGHANLNLDREEIDEKEAMLRKRDKKKTIVVGDSGGFQIGTGVLKFDWKNFEGEDNNKLRMKILRWLEATADYSMTLDVPVWGVGNKKMGIDTFDDCLKKTLWNHDFFIKHRKEGATKFLNVLHGRNIEETDIWYDAVKDLPFEGWALGSANTRDFEIMLRRFITMRDDKKLNKDQSWIHILGVSRLVTSCAYSTIQKTLREHVDPAITISYDASSPFYSTAKGRLYSRMTYSRDKLNYTLDGAVDNKDMAGSNLPFPIMSPIGNKLTMGDMCLRGHDYPSKSSWDSMSYLFLMNHNCYMHIKGILESHRLYNLPHRHAQEFIPAHLLEFKDLVAEIFTSETPFDVISENHKLLNNLSGLKLSDRGVNSIKSNSIFQLEDSMVDLTDGEDEANFDDSIIDDIDAAA